MVSNGLRRQDLNLQANSLHHPLHWRDGLTAILQDVSVRLCYKTKFGFSANSEWTAVCLGAGDAQSAGGEGWQGFRAPHYRWLEDLVVHNLAPFGYFGTLRPTAELVNLFPCCSQ